MTSRDFAYWLQGFFEVQNPTTITATQLEMIKKHLNLVFKHEIDPSMGDEEHQGILNAIHNKVTLQELGEKHGFEVHEGTPTPKPAGWKSNWKYSSLHKMWYDPEQGEPRC